MGLPDHVRRLRERVGNDLLLLPSVSVMVRDEAGRVLLVRHSASGDWGLVGGAVQVDERPEDAAVRETEEETGLHVELTGLIAVQGGPDFRVTYPNGDQAAYVSAVYEARAVGGRARPDGDETTDVGWFALDELSTAGLGPFAEASFRALGWLGTSSSMP